MAGRPTPENLGERAGSSSIVSADLQCSLVGFGKQSISPQLRLRGALNRVMAPRTKRQFGKAHSCLSATRSECHKVNQHPNFNPQFSQLSVAGKSPNNQQRHRSLNINAGSFDSWWQGIFAQHAVMTAQASALVAAHRRVSASSESHVDQAH